MSDHEGRGNDWKSRVGYGIFHACICLTTDASSQCRPVPLVLNDPNAYVTAFPNLAKLVVIPATNNLLHCGSEQDCLMEINTVSESSAG
jgi:hypothetical protein